MDSDTSSTTSEETVLSTSAVSPHDLKGEMPSSINAQTSNVPTSNGLSSDKTASTSAPIAEASGSVINAFERLLERQRRERMFELRRLKFGDRPVTGQDHVQRLDQFFSGENSQTNTAERPEPVQDDIKALVESRPVSSLMANADTKRLLEESLEATLIRNGRSERMSPQTPPTGTMTGSNIPPITVQTPSSTEGSVELPEMPPSSCGETPNQMAADLELKERELTELRHEVSRLRLLLSRSLKTQTDIQRAIRQEVAAAMQVSQPHQRDLLSPFTRELSHGHQRLIQPPDYYTNFPRMVQRPSMAPSRISRYYDPRTPSPSLPQLGTRMSQMLKTQDSFYESHGGCVIGSSGGVVVGPIRRPVSLSGPIPKPSPDRGRKRKADSS